MGKNIPEKKIDSSEINKLTIFPTLKTMINEADIMPSPMNGNEQKIAKLKKSGVLDKSSGISKKYLQIIK